MRHGPAGKAIQGSNGMRLKFHTLDVFTSARFAGNPLAVVLDADALDTIQMHKIAREFNLSETVFVLSTNKPAHTARLRIFTPGGEVPFAGHPTVGTAALLAELRAPETNGERDALVVLEENIGTVRVGVRQKPDTPAHAEFDAPKLPEPVAGVPPTDLLSAALGLIPSEIGLENHRPSAYSAGLPFVFVPVQSLDAIARASPNMAHWSSAFGKTNAAYLYCRETVHATSHFHARMFAPNLGVMEDPATGSAAAAFAAVIVRFDSPRDGMQKKIIEQGFEMGRPSFVETSLVVRQGKLETVRIAGHAIRVSEGVIEV
jgi:trans-2,3-dihydro-3-hydroxyanthranilate isomerase